MTDKMKPSDGILPYRYSGIPRKPVHLRMTNRMWLKLLKDKRLTGSIPQRIRFILERYLSRDQ